MNDEPSQPGSEQTAGNEPGAPQCDAAQPDADEDDGGQCSPADLISESGVSEKQERAIVALLREPTIGKAAIAAGVTERTLYKWMIRPVFAAAYRRARREAFGQAIALTQRFAPLAVHTLVGMLGNEKIPPAVRVSAASALLKFGREGIELDDLAARVEALEQAAKDAEEQKSDVGRGTSWATAA